jgi:alpha-tubulin suppressor-like RCC1 family protein
MCIRQVVTRQTQQLDDGGFCRGWRSEVLMGRRPLPLFILVAAAASVGACGGSSELSSPDPVGPPASLRIVSGNEQRGVAGQVLPEPVVVQVVDSSDHPVPNQTVTFLVVVGGGSVSAGNGLTNSSGMVEEHWTLGPTPGEPQTLYVRVADDGTGAPVIFTTFTAVAEPAPTELHFQVVQAGGIHSCGLTVEGQAYCWGTNSVDGTRLTTPTAIAGGLTFTRLAAGMGHTCGLTSAGAAYCWGDNRRGQLGDGTTNSTSAPRPVSGGHVFREIAAGADHTCALTASGAAYCWGGNNFGDAGGYLGDGTITDRLVPTQVLGGLTFQALSLGSSFTCGLTTAGLAYCWGRLLGNREGVTHRSPAAVTGGFIFAAISAGFGHACGLLADGTAYCWGDNFSGELGYGTPRESETPIRVAGDLTFAAIGAGGFHTCALTLSGALACWGWDDTFVDSRAFNDGTSIHSTAPVLVPGGHTFVALSEGLAHGCGVTADHVAHCWFDNDSGELGSGNFTGSYQPVPVR